METFHETTTYSKSFDELKDNIRPFYGNAINESSLNEEARRLVNFFEILISEDRKTHENQCH